jgi:hypothetical protein
VHVRQIRGNSFPTTVEPNNGRVQEAVQMWLLTELGQGVRHRLSAVLYVDAAPRAGPALRYGDCNPYYSEIATLAARIVPAAVAPPNLARATTRALGLFSGSFSSRRYKGRRSTTPDTTPLEPDPSTWPRSSSCSNAALARSAGGGSPGSLGPVGTRPAPPRNEPPLRVQRDTARSAGPIV